MTAGTKRSAVGPPTFVFVHGFLGFGLAHAVTRVVPYFRGLAGAMQQMGISYVVPRLPAAGTVAERSRALADQLSGVAADRLVLVGHSMGGLDARYLAHHFDPDRRVRGLVTLATPHRGTAVAEHLLAGRGAFCRLAQRYWRPGLEELTPEACRRRNEALTDRADIRCVSYAGERPRGELPVWLRPLADVLDGPNDGLVTVASAEWGALHPILRADHFEIVGWSFARSRAAVGHPFPHLALYRSIIEDASGIGATD